jgi:hypothetical protein
MDEEQNLIGLIIVAVIAIAIFARYWKQILSLLAVLVVVFVAYDGWMTYSQSQNNCYLENNQVVRENCEKTGSMADGLQAWAAIEVWFYLIPGAGVMFAKGKTRGIFIVIFLVIAICSILIHIWAGSTWIEPY